MGDLLSDKDTKKRQHSPDANTSNSPTVQQAEKNDDSKDNNGTKRRQITTDQDEDGDLLTQLTAILTEIKTTPSTGEISADLLGELRHLMLQIEDLAADGNNVEARQLKDESDKYLELWFEELVAQCDADGEIDWENMGHDHLDQGGGNENDDESDDEETIALAMALQDEEDAVENDDDERQTGTTTSTEAFKTVELDDHTGLADDDDLAHATAAQVNG